MRKLISLFLIGNVFCTVRDGRKHCKRPGKLHDTGMDRDL